MTARASDGARYDPELGPVLVGMRGSGKSTLAAPLAAALGFSAVDADAEFERQAGQSISEIFATRGEAAFRALERALLLDDLLERPRCVLATGGGAVLHPEVRQVLCCRVTVWLKAPLSVLAERVAGTGRPSLKGRGASSSSELEAVLAAREPLYGDVATLSLDTNSGGPSQLTERIAESWRRLVSTADVSE